MRPGRSLVRKLLVVPLVLLLAVVSAAAPSRVFSGSIQGRVTDQVGAAIQNAQVVVVGTSMQAQTDGRGWYSIPNVPAGIYTVRASFIGYKRAQSPGVRVIDGSPTRQDFQLESSPVVVEDIAIVGADGKRRQDLVPRDKVSVSANAYEESSVSLRGAPPQPTSGVIGGAVRKQSRAHADWNTEDYHHRIDSRFLTVAANPLSTFAIDVDAASYANVRRFLTQGQLPPADAVRIEELINYFSYDYPAPESSQPFAITTAQMPAPWASDHKLVMVGVQGRKIPVEKLPPSNLVFLLDVSGSMESPDKLPLVKRAFRLLVDQLREQDRVAIVVYAGAAGLILPSTPGNEKDEILGAIDRLHAGGSTAGGAGIQLAYDIARRYHIEGGNNRVILATDGDFNVGVSSEGELVRLVEERKQQGTYLTVLGFGTGNLKDSRMEALADKGNGHYAYVDDIMEARKVFVEELGATLVTIAKDVKIQVEFNPAEVKEYRLIGYENRLLAAEDFNDDKKDGGELGAGHSVTALYEIIPAGAKGTGGNVDDLKYRATDRDGGRNPGEVLTVKLRWQHPTEAGASRLVSRSVRTARSDGNLANLRFASAVAQFGMLLRKSEYKGSSSWESVRALARQGMGEDEGGYRAEFLRLVELARTLSGETEVGLQREE